MMTKLDVQTYRKDDIIFRQGEEANCIYQIQWGTVGIFVDYGSKKERQVARLHAEQFFGEMALIEGGPRTATAVALEGNTRLQVITPETFRDCFRNRPEKVLMFLQHMSRRIRQLTAEYLDACKVVAAAVDARKCGSAMSAEMQSELHRLAENYRKSQ